MRGAHAWLCFDRLCHSRRPSCLGSFADLTVSGTISLFLFTLGAWFQWASLLRPLPSVRGSSPRKANSRRREDAKPTGQPMVADGRVTEERAYRSPTEGEPLNRGGASP